jgi:hypothetical protein
MHIQDHKLITEDGSEIPLPELPVPAVVSVWAVPTEYRPTGYYIDTTPVGKVKTHPACRTYTFIGTFELEAHRSALVREAKQKRIQHINDVAETIMNDFTSDYGFHTKLSWTDQKNEATAYLTDPASPTPTLTAIAEGRGIGVRVLAEKVMIKAATYQMISGRVMGECQRCEDLIESMPDATATVEDVMSVEFNLGVVTT